jgi:tetrahydromethanopterin S-methyltransferase subunit E
MWNLTIVGPAVVIFALFAAVAFNAWKEWTNMALGIWLFISPWVLGFHASEALRWNSVVAGLLIAALAAWVLVQERAKADQQRAGNQYGGETLR